VPVTNLALVLKTDRAKWTKFFHAMLERGVLLPPSPFEAWFVSSAHDDAAIDHVVNAAEEAYGKL
jgi:glutamate-1-semialdehyde 2,1-aminomutase